MAKSTETGKVVFKIGNYTLLDKLGEGGFGVVRKAVRDHDGQLVAIKIFDKQDLQVNEMTQQVKKEIAILTVLDHPAIVKGYEVLSSQAKIFVIMEYIGGGDFHTLLSKRNHLTELETKIFFRTLLDCLAYCHKKGIYHRDLKLENLLLTSDGRLKVCDFGLASVKALNPNHGMCQTVVGTKSFSPPEIIKRIPYSGEKADMWSAGIILYILLTGFSPFEGKNQRDLVERICSCHYKFPSDFPPLAKRLVKSLLVQDPNKRASATQALQCEWFVGESPRSVILPPKPPLPSQSINHKRRTIPRPKRRALTEELASTENEEHFNYLARSFDSAGDYSNPTDIHVLYGALGRARIPSFSKLYHEMRDSRSGLVVKDRRWRFRTFESCFVGSEAVDWLVLFTRCNREHAIYLGQQLLQIGAFHHVCREHEFEDAYLFYRWHDHDPSNMMVANLNTPFMKTHQMIRADLATKETLKLLLEFCSAHQELHDQRVVNMVRLQNDQQLKSYFELATDLQAVNIDSMIRHEHRVSFLVNLHNILWIIARICIGDFETMSFDEMELTASRFSYMIGNVRVSLLDIYRLLFDRCEQEDSLLSDSDTNALNHNHSEPKRTNRKKKTPIKSKKTSTFLNRLISKGNDVNMQLEDVFQGFEVTPLVHFITSDGSPRSPAIIPITGADITKQHFEKCVARYLNAVIEIDVETNTVFYPEKVARYRDAIQADHDEHFVATLTTLCGGKPIEKQLKRFLRESHEQKREIYASVIEEDSKLDRRSLFAPIIGYLKD